MKIILKQDVKDLGKKGEAKEVADGFARNYLIPKGLAKQASEGDIAQLQEEHVHEKERAEHELSAAQRLAAELDGEEITIIAKANEQGEFYGAISDRDIAAALKKEGYAVSAGHITLEEPIKDVGEHTVVLSLNDGIEAELRVLAEAEKDKESEKDAA